MSMRNILLSLLIGLGISAPVQAAEFPVSAPVTTEISHTQLVSEQNGIIPGEPFRIGLQMKLQPEWHSYWLNPGDSGIPLTMKITVPEGFKAGEPVFPSPEIIDTAGIINYGFSDEVTFPLEITSPQHIGDDISEITISMKANWLVCKDVCIPESGNYTLNLPVLPQMDQIATNPDFLLGNNTYPLNNTSLNAYYSRNKDAVQLRIPDATLPVNAHPLAFYPLVDGIVRNSAPLTMTRESGVIAFTFPSGTLHDGRELKGLLVLNTGGMTESYWISASADMASSAAPSSTPPSPSSGPQTSDPASHASLPSTLLSALGLALLGGLILNIMPCVLPVLSLKLLALTRKSGASRTDLLRHGLAYTLGVLLTFMAIAGLLVTLKLAGAEIGWGFQLQSPEFVITLSVVMLLVALNLLGLFELPVLLGSAGQHLTSQNTAMGSFFTGVLATLVATPCTAPFMAPAIGFALTQPPFDALLIFQALGFGLALPFLLICAFPSMLRALPRPGVWMQTFKEILAFPMLATLAWLLWVLTLQAGAEALLHALFILLAVGFMIWAMTRLAPPRRYYCLAGAIGIILWLVAGLPVRDAREDMAELPYSPSKLEQLRQGSTPVFVNATAAWCLTCKLNEMSTLSAGSVKDYFAKHGVVYMEANWTNRDEEISRYLESFDRQGVPLYVYYPSGQKAPIVLPQVLTPSLVVETLQEAEKTR